MMQRTWDIETVINATNQYRENITGFYPVEWLLNDDNLAFANEFGDVTLFEWMYPGVYTGHYFFLCRGKQALNTARETLDLVFKEYPVKVIRGITPIDHLGARWMSRKLGFKSHGFVETIKGTEEVFILTKDDWEGNK